jgi:hypothetical protein
MAPYGPAMTVTFAELEAAAPEIASFVRRKIEETGLALVATTRSDGWPRASGWELFLCDGRIYVGSMPGAVKVQDLRRDPRCCLVTPLRDKDDLEGEGKLFCVAREIDTREEHERVREAFRELRDFDMGEWGAGGHVFEMAIDGAAFQRVVGDDFRTTSWNVRDGRRERTRTGPLGESVELP